LLDNTLRRKIASIWQTDKVSRVKPSSQGEAERNTVVVEIILWESLLSFMHKLDVSMKDSLGKTMACCLLPSL